MSKYPYLLIISFSFFLLSGCVTMTHLKPVKTKGVKQLLFKGKNQLLSKKKNSEVSLYLSFPKIGDGSEMDLLIELLNLSEKPAYIDTKKIKITKNV